MDADGDLDPIRDDPAFAEIMKSGHADRRYNTSIALLDAYARYSANSNERAWMCGSLLPNDLGLFDTLGNAFEWCQDSTEEFTRSNKKTSYDVIAVSKYINEKNPRFLRGGSFYYHSAIVRSAEHSWSDPADRNTIYGFRPSRTYP
jgi:formylglycine-generating enzyme required for sulfatase activity